MATERHKLVIFWISKPVVFVFSAYSAISASLWSTVSQLWHKHSHFPVFYPLLLLFFFFFLFCVDWPFPLLSPLLLFSRRLFESIRRGMSTWYLSFNAEWRWFWTFALFQNEINECLQTLSLTELMICSSWDLFFGTVLWYQVGNITKLLLR